MTKHRALKLWVVTLRDITPGWGVSATWHIASTTRPTKEKLRDENWHDALQVSIGDLGETAFWRQRVRITVRLMTPAEFRQSRANSEHKVQWLVLD